MENQEPQKTMVIAVDFDSTLVTSAYPAIGNMILETFTSILTLKKLGCQIVLWTCRSGELLKNAVEWCAERGLEFDAVNTEAPYTRTWKKYISRKIYADIYVDDKGMPPHRLNQIVDLWKKERDTNEPNNDRC